MLKEQQVSLIEIVMALSIAMDLMNNKLHNHHIQVAYIAGELASHLGYDKQKQQEIILSGLLHDSGMLSLKERMQALEFFETDNDTHSEIGYLLLKIFPPFENIANQVRYHHTYWNKKDNLEDKGHNIPEESFIIHLADRVAISIHRQSDILAQIPAIQKKIKKFSGDIFNPTIVDAFMDLSQKEYFWFDSISPILREIIIDKMEERVFHLSTQELINLSTLFGYIIDVKSKFTATHSSGVAATSRAILEKLGFPDDDLQRMEIAGYLHDLGKLSIPSEIIEKQGPLTQEEFNIIKQHPYYTYSILNSVKNFETIAQWGAYHHERLDGSGYPFHFKEIDIPLPSKVVAVADVFTALKEDRPYRKGMSDKETIQILQQMVKTHHLSSDPVAILLDHYQDVNSSRISAQIKENQQYLYIMQGNPNIDSLEEASLDRTPETQAG